MISTDVQQKIKYLSEKIKNDQATLDEYKEYEKILINAGVDQYKLKAKLNEAGFDSWENYLTARTNAITLVQKREVNNALVVGALVGLGLAVLIGLVSKK